MAIFNTFIISYTTASTLGPSGKEATLNGTPKIYLQKLKIKKTVKNCSTGIFFVLPPIHML